MIIQGNAHDVLIDDKTIEPGSIQTAITSPPYYRLRNYSNDEREIGNEDTVEAYVASLVRTFQAVKHALQADGTFWLNLGDTYERGRLLGVPWRVALALMDDGWVLRNSIIWHKPNPMPESCKNRLTKSHEHLFLFAKKTGGYKFNQLKEPAVYAGQSRGGSTNRYEQNAAGMDAKTYDTRNKRDVWSVRPATLHGYHSAIFPDELIAPCIEAGSDPGDIVLDPFAGSGTTGLVARKMGREFIGIELSTKYAELARKRLSGAMTIKRPTELQTWHKSYKQTAEAFELTDDADIRSAHAMAADELDRQRADVFEHNDAIDMLLGARSRYKLKEIKWAEDPDGVLGFDELVERALGDAMFASLLGGNAMTDEEGLFQSLKEGRRPLPTFDDALDAVAVRVIDRAVKK